MTAQSNRSEDKRLLLRLSEALETSDRRMGLDPCGDWNIRGSRGHISTDARLWYVYIPAGSPRRWTAIKKKLAFLDLHVDGDDEGILKLERMPVPAEARIIRKTLGLRQKPQLTEADRAELKNRLNAPSKKGVSGDFSGLPASGGYQPPGQP